LKFEYNKLKNKQVNRSTRNPISFDDSRLSRNEFKRVLPIVMKDSVSGKGSSTLPG
jgi:hypothetical protein